MSEKNEKLNEFWGKTKDLGKKVANDTKKGAEKLYQSVKENVHNYRVNKYKPLFMNDDSIKGLIEMRCSGNNNVLSRTLKLEGATSATMSQSIASTIDLLLNERVGIKNPKLPSQTKQLEVSLWKPKQLKKAAVH